MKFILGTKSHMTQIFDQKGTVKAGTVLRVEPMTVTQKKTVETDGYTALQLATGAQKESRMTKAERVHLGGGFRFVREYRPEDGEEVSLEKGATFDVSAFAVGDKVVVSATSKGKGFQGVVKRHGFGGGRASHGQKHSLREAGSIGGGARAGGRVAKGMRMAGRMGGDRITVKNLVVLAVNPAENTLVLSGAVPGRRGTLVEVRGM